MKTLSGEQETVSRRKAEGGRPMTKISPLSLPFALRPLLSASRGLPLCLPPF